MTIDAHQHFWKYDPEKYAWIDDSLAVLKKDFLPADLGDVLREADVDAAVSVQAQQSVEETEWLLTLADSTDFVVGVVGWVPLTSPAVSEVIAEISEHPLLKGVRHVLQDEPDPDYFLREDFNRGVAALDEQGLVYDILIYEDQLPRTIEFVDRHPHQMFVVDHVAKPRIAAGEMSPWRERLQRLAERDNCVCKISGMVTEADWDAWTPGDLRRYFDVALSAFGAERLMFGSDWPVCLAATTYAEWRQVVDAWLSSLSGHEKGCILGGTAVEIYELDVG